MSRVIKYRIGLNNSDEVFDFSLHQIVKGLAANRITISFFKPIVAISIYDKFLINKINPTVIDPCAGFGGRLLGFKSKFPNGTYIGIEPNKETFNELELLVKNSGFNNVKLYNCKAEDYRGTFDCDMTFTSIPYYDIETYSDNIVGNDYSDKENWYNVFVNSLFNFKNLVLNVPKEIGDKLIVDKKIEDKDIYYLANNITHFNKNRDKKHEYIINFR